MTMIRLLPPAGLVDVSYGGRRVPPGGIYVDEAEAEALELEGWTREAEVHEPDEPAAKPAPEVKP